MARQTTPLYVSDLSAFTRSLARALDARAVAPGHLELQNLIARAAGFRNLQALKASPPPPDVAERAPPPPLSANARRALLQFDAAGRLIRWPTKYTLQKLATWTLWTRFETRRTYSEREVNAILRSASEIVDHVGLRRALVDHRLLARKPDGSAYWKLPARPDAETRALLGAWRARTRGPAIAPAAPPADVH